MEYKKINMPGLLHGGDYNPEQWLDAALYMSQFA